MKWVFEDSPNEIKSDLNKIRFEARLRRNRQISIPKFMLDQLEKQLGKIPIGASGRTMNCQLVCDIKAIHINNTWYRIQSEDKKTSDELQSDTSKEEC
tara:strand:- start:40868 stop:41161 length:294 start_codon:yes stop_codon:yes gene_type:complete